MGSNPIRRTKQNFGRRIAKPENSIFSIAKTSFLRRCRKSELLLVQLLNYSLIETKRPASQEDAVKARHQSLIACYPFFNQPNRFVMTTWYLFKSQQFRRESQSLLQSHLSSQSEPNESKHLVQNKITSGSSNLETKITQNQKSVRLTSIHEME